MGATRIKIGKPQLKAYKNHCELSVETKTSASSLWFETGVQNSIGKFSARLPVPNKSYMEFKTSIIPIDISFLIGLKEVLEYNISFNFEIYVIKQTKTLESSNV